MEISQEKLESILKEDGEEREAFLYFIKKSQFEFVKVWMDQFDIENPIDCTVIDVVSKVIFKLIDSLTNKILVNNDYSSLDASRIAVSELRGIAGRIESYIAKSTSDVDSLESYIAKLISDVH